MNVIGHETAVDDRSGVAYQEYHCVYGEDVVTALRFLFNAMAAKASPDFPLQGIPLLIYMDNGPVARSQVFQRVMRYLGIEVRMHMPAGKDGRRTTARSKGKVERPFRTVKEIHETLYHFQKPRDEIDSELAGVEVVLWWGLFDQELFVEHGEKRLGPYLLVRAPIPLNRYRAFKKSTAQRRADRIELLAAQLEMPRAALESRPDVAVFIRPGGIPAQTFTDPDPFNQLTYPSTLAAKPAISEFLGLPLAKQLADQLARIEELVQSTLNKQEVLAQVRACIGHDERLPENQPHAE